MSGPRIPDSHIRSAGTFSRGLLSRDTHLRTASSFLPRPTAQRHPRPSRRVVSRGLSTTRHPSYWRPLFLTRPMSPRHPWSQRRVLSRGLPSHDTHLRNASFPRPYFCRHPKPLRRGVSWGPCFGRHPQHTRPFLSCPASPMPTPIEGSPGTFLRGPGEARHPNAIRPLISCPAVLQATSILGPPGLDRLQHMNHPSW